MPTAASAQGRRRRSAGEVDKGSLAPVASRSTSAACLPGAAPGAVGPGRHPSVLHFRNLLGLLLSCQRALRSRSRANCCSSDAEARPSDPARNRL